MVWFKVDDTLAFHAKTIAAGNPAMGLWVRAGAVSAQQLTDGFVAHHMVAALGTLGQAKRLVLVGLWMEVEGGYRFHEWADRQPSKASVEAERASAVERMRARREQRRNGARQASSQVSELCSPEQPPNEQRTSENVRRVFGHPDPTRPDPTRPKEELPRDDVARLCEHLASRVEANGVKRPAITKRWQDSARLLIDNDGFTEQQLIWLIDRSTSDEFWRQNILSMPKFREKAQQLKLKFSPTIQQSVRYLPRAEDLEKPPDGLSPEEYRAWQLEQMRKRAVSE